MLIAAAYVVAKQGPAYAGYLTRLEREVEAARRDDPVAPPTASLKRMPRAAPSV